MKSLRPIARRLTATVAIAALAGCGSSPTAPSTTLDSTPPPAPADLRMVADGGSGRNRLEWTPSAAPDVALYQVFEYLPDPSRESAYAVVVDTDEQDTSYLMPAASGDATWYFRVRAVDAAGNRSAYSAVYEAQVAPAPAPAGGGGGGGGSGDHDPHGPIKIPD